MVFVHPLVLWLLLLAPMLAYAGRGAPQGRWRFSKAVLRGTCVAAMVTAIAQPMLGVNTAETTPVAVIDLSSAVSDDAVAAFRSALDRPSAGHKTTNRIVAFANHAELLVDPSELAQPDTLAALRQRLSKRDWSDDPAAGGTNLASALELAAAQIPPNGRGEIALYATGLSNHEDAAAAAWRLSQRGIAVTPIAINVDGTGLAPVRMLDVIAPVTARIGQTITAEFTIESSVSAEATVRLTAANGHPTDTALRVEPGLNHGSVSLPLTSTGLIPVEASAWIGTPPERVETTVRAAIDVEPAATVVLVEDSPEAGLSESLSALLGSGAEVVRVTPERLAKQLSSRVDAVILADVPADHLSPASQAMLRQAVHDGTGLLIAGAARSFGPGGYDTSQLASLLPVKMTQQTESIDPSTALVLVIDTSGSMQGTRIDLAKQVASLALSHLRPQDKVGIVEFYAGKRWAAPIQSAANLSIIHRALDRLTAGGGTTLYPAVEEAAFGLHNVHTRSKHVLILSDGFVENAPFSSLVRQMADDGIVVSTVQVTSPDGSPNQMPDIARWGGGHYYSVVDQYELPDITLKQPKLQLLSPFVQTESPVVAGNDALVRLIKNPHWEPVQGYVRTQAKPTADVLLKTESGDPLLARWRYGDGFVAALPTQLGSVMTGKLQQQQAFAKLVTGLLRQLDDQRALPLAVQPRVRAAGVEVDVTASSREWATSTETVTVTLADASGVSIRSTSAEAIAPGHWNVLLPGVTAGAYELIAKVGNQAAIATGVAGVAIPLPRPIPAMTKDQSTLDQIASFAADANELAAKLPIDRTKWIELRNPLIAAALLLLIAHVGIRRWPHSVRPRSPVA